MSDSKKIITSAATTTAAQYSADQFDNNLIEFPAWFCNVNIPAKS